MSAKKTLHMPTQLDYKTMREVPQTLVGYTADGHVGFTVAGIELVNKVEISSAAGDRLSHELLRACYHAGEADKEARGLNEWITRPLAGGLVEVSYRGERAAFRPIVNGKRRTRGLSTVVAVPIFLKPGTPPTTEPLKGGHRCTACKKASPEGATMYVAIKKDEPGFIGGEPLNWGFGGVRLCNSCVHPELAAAVLGAALMLAGADKDGAS